MKGLLVAWVCACPLALHAAVLHGNPWLVALVSTAIAANFVLLAARTALPRWPIAAVGGAALIAGLLDREIAARLAFLPPTLICGFLCWAFARTLVRGREPLVTRIARLERDGELSEPLVVYTRRVTWLWAVALALMAVASAALARFAEPATWSFFTNILSYALLGALFVLEYLYRLVRYPGIRHHPPWRAAAGMLGRAGEVFR